MQGEGRITGGCEILDVSAPLVPWTQERDMTTKTAFSPEDWKVVLEGPPTARA